MPVCACGATLRENQKFCVECGKPVPAAPPPPPAPAAPPAKPICAVCGKEVPSGRFCTECGTPLPAAPTPPLGGFPPPPPPPPPGGSAPPLFAGPPPGGSAPAPLAGPPPGPSPAPTAGAGDGVPPHAPRPERPPESDEAPEDDGEPLFVLDPASGFPDDSRRFYPEESDEGPEYHIFNRQESTAGLALYDAQAFGGAEIVARVARLSGNRDGGYGLAFLAQDARSFCCFLMTANQDFCVARLVDNQWTDLVEWTRCEHICGGDDENEVTVRLYPGMIRILVNGNLVEVVRTSLPAKGGLGLIASCPNMHVVCRSLEVRPLPR